MRETIVQTVIMVQIADDPAWTREALHCAALMARDQSAKIALVKMMPVQHLGWLGTGLGYLNLSHQDEQELADLAVTLEDYSMDFDFYPFQYATLADAIGQAAEYLDAQVIFATLPKGIIPFWRAYQVRGLRRHFARDGRQFIDQPEYTPVSSPVPDSLFAQA